MALGVVVTLGAVGCCSTRRRAAPAQSAAHRRHAGLPRPRRARLRGRLLEDQARQVARPDGPAETRRSDRHLAGLRRVLVLTADARIHHGGGGLARRDAGFRLRLLCVGLSADDRPVQRRQPDRWPGRPGRRPVHPGRPGAGLGHPRPAVRLRPVAAVQLRPRRLPAWAFCGTTRTRPRCSWATRARSPSARRWRRWAF